MLKMIGAGLALAVALSTGAQARLSDMPMFDRHGVSDYTAPSARYRARTAHQHAKRHPVSKITFRAILVIIKRPEAGIPLPRSRPKDELKPELALLQKARLFMGKNPTGWRSVWCARFMAMIAPRAARRVRNPNLARDWAQLPHTTAHVGAIVVLARDGGGHVGIVEGFDRHGNPIVISGNHGHKVGRGVYSKGRVLAYVQA